MLTSLFKNENKNYIFINYNNFREIESHNFSIESINIIDKYIEYCEKFKDFKKPDSQIECIEIAKNHFLKFENNDVKLFFVIVFSTHKMYVKKYINFKNRNLCT